ncbi:hypothetical protein BH10BDE1_BH10BDE1_27910 [soil metagenome]
MRFLVFAVAALTLTSGCVTRTAYQPMNESGGYSDAKLDERVSVARFAGNAHTHKDDAALFSQFRAIEICRERGFQIARFFDVRDLTTSQDVQRSSTVNNTAPTHFNGTANSNTNLNSTGNGFANANTQTNIYGTFTGGQTSSSSRTWTETYVFPTFDTTFACSNGTFITKIKLKPISSDEMKPFVKDLLGAVQVEEFIDGSPNREVLKVGDLITKVNGERLTSLVQFSSMVDAAKDKSKLIVSLVREGKAIAIKLKAVDATLYFAEEAEKLIRSACTVPEVKKRPICASRLPASK